MSDDESDYGELDNNPPARTRAPRYYILHLKWRNKTVRPFVHILDLIYCIVRRISLRRRGAYPRQRQDNSTTARYSTSSSFVPGCPISAYSEDWITTQRDLEFAVYPSMERYEFAHDPEVLRQVKRSPSLSLAKTNLSRSFVRNRLSEI